MIKKIKVAVLVSHPIQYFSPMYRAWALHPEIELNVFYCSKRGLESYRDEWFGKDIKWDIPLTSGFEHTFLKNWRSGLKVLGFFALINPSICKYLIKGKYDVLWVHGYSNFTSVLAIFFCLFLKTKVAMYGDSNLDKLWLRKQGAVFNIRKVLLSLYFKLINLFFVVGEKNRAYYTYHKVSDKKMISIPFAVDNAFFKAFPNDADYISNRRKEYGIKDDCFVILFAGKFVAGKKVMDLLHAFHRLIESGLSCHLVLVGSGTEQSKYEAFIQAHSLSDYVLLPGFKNQSELPAFYALADVFVYPCTKESWGLAINEAMCFGLPIITTHETGAAGDIVKDGVNGFLMETGDIELLYTKLAYMVQNPNEVLEMGHKSDQIISQWNFERGVANFVEQWKK